MRRFIAFTILVFLFLGVVSSHAQVKQFSDDVSVFGTDTIGCGCAGSLEVVIQNDTSSYSFFWSTGNTDSIVENLCSGTYSVTVIDTVYFDTTEVLYTIVDTCLSIEVIGNDSVTPWSCNGALSAQVSGGTGPYIYTWSNGTSQQINDNLCPGIYCVTVSDSEGHTGVQCYEILSFQDTTCNADFYWSPAGSQSCYETCFQFHDNSSGNGSIFWSFGDSIFATSSNPVFSFAEYGNHEVCLQVETQYCRDTLCIDVAVNPCAFVVDAQSSGVSIAGACDGSIELNFANATYPLDFQWTGTSGDSLLTGLCEGNYCVTVTDAFACKDSVCVNIVSLPDTSCQAEFDVERQGLSHFNFFGVFPPDIASWQWDFGDETFSSADTVIHIYPELASYTVCLGIETLTGCRDTFCQTINIDTCHLTLNSSILDVSCYGLCDGQVMLTAVDGAPPFTYAWESPDSQVVGLNIYTGLCSGSYPVTVSDKNFCSYSTIVNIASPQELEGNSSITQILCYGECNATIALSATGGIQPYSYYLDENSSVVSGTITGLCDGNYTIITTDNEGCKDTALYIIDAAPQQLGFNTITSQDISCWLGCDGEVQVLVEGGTLPYSYIWNNGAVTPTITGLCFNQYNYKVTVTDANLCTVDTMIVIGQPPPLMVNLSKSDVTCNGICNGAVSGTVIGGTWPYSFDWSNGASGNSLISLCSGSYTATVTDGNLCTSSGNIFLDEPDSLVAAITLIENVLCNGVCSGEMTVAAYGGTPPLSAAWSNDSSSFFISQLCAGVYQAVVTDANNCSVTVSDEIQEPDAITVIFQSAPESEINNCDGSVSVTAIGGAAPLSFLWADNSSDSVLEQLCSGQYFVTITDVNGCSLSDSIVLAEPLSYSFSGRVYAGTNVLPEGMCLLYKQEGELWSAVQYDLIINGLYSFNHLGAGRYLVYAVPYFDVVLQTPIYLPTYFGNRVYWTSASQLELSSDTSYIDIFLSKNENILYGQASVSGSVAYNAATDYEDEIYGQNWFGAFQGKSTKIAGLARNIPVLILGSDNKPLKFVLSDSTGSFSLSNLPFGNYKVHPEKAGYHTYTHSLTLDEIDTQIGGLEFLIGNNIITTGIGEENDDADTQISIFPNPVGESLTIVIDNLVALNGAVEVYSPLGVIVLSREFSVTNTSHLFTIDTKKLSPGTYMVLVRSNNKVITTSKIVKF